MIAVIASGCSVSGDARVRELREVPAHWVKQADTHEPNSGDFLFDALFFSTPSDGWIVGNRYLLHIVDHQITVTFTKSTGAWLGSVNFRTSADGWMGGFRTERSWRDQFTSGVIWHLHNGVWEPANLNGVGLWDWLVHEVRRSPRGDLWATGILELNGEPPPAPQRFRRILVRSEDGSAWRLDPTPRDGERRWSFFDACFFPSGDGWFVGSDIADPDHDRLLAVRYRNGVWEHAVVPDVPGPSAWLARVKCLPDGRAVAIGTSGYSPDQSGSPVVLRHDGEWQPLELPANMDNASLGAVAALSASDLWLAVSSRGTGDRFRDRPTFLHWVDGQWMEVAPPLLPEGRIDGYSFKDMQFVSPDEGWAIANDYDGPGLVRGLVFHYRDGVWRNRNWNWHFWDAPGFGLWEH